MVAADGSITAKGKGFSVTYDDALKAGQMTGDTSAVDADACSEKPVFHKQSNDVWTVEDGAKKLEDPRFGLTYYVGTQQVSGDLQQPLFLGCKTGDPCTKDAFGFQVWEWWASLRQGSVAQPASLDRRRQLDALTRSAKNARAHARRHLPDREGQHREARLEQGHLAADAQQHVHAVHDSRPLEERTRARDLGGFAAPTSRASRTIRGAA